MVSQDSLLVTLVLVKLVDCVPMPTLPPKRGRQHPIVYPDRLFLKALVIMIVRHLFISNPITHYQDDERLAFGLQDLCLVYMGIHGKLYNPMCNFGLQKPTGCATRCTPFQAKWLWTVLRCIHGFCTETELLQHR